MSSCTLLLLLAFSPSALPQTASIPVSLAGDWKITVGPGEAVLGGRKVRLAQSVSLEITPPERISIRDERHEVFPVFDPKTAGWSKGARLKSLITEECSATGLLYPESLCVKSASGALPSLKRGSDFEADDFWGTVGALEGGSIAAGKTVWIDYDYSPCRLDSVLVDASGQPRLVRGTSGVGIVMPPDPTPGDTAILNIWVPGRTERLSGENLFPIEDVHPLISPEGPSQAERFLPKTLAKLRSGGEVVIVAWGDSVTDGGGVNAAAGHRYQDQFHRRLSEKFPQSRIKMLTAAWGGRGSRNYLDAPRGGPKDFVRDVLEPKPDLVTIEFVNDAYLDEEATQPHYKKIMDLLQNNGSEVILITPHLVRADWMEVSTSKFDEDPRPYVKGLRRFAQENHMALADASRLWCGLWRQGIPYITLEANSINHPDVRGHRMFADALMSLFP